MSLDSICAANRVFLSTPPPRKIDVPLNPKFIISFFVDGIIAENNHPQALVLLGEIYENGLGVEEDVVKAKNYFTKALPLLELDFDSNQDQINILRERLES